MQLLGKHPMAKAPEEAISPQNPSLFNTIGLKEEMRHGVKAKPFNQPIRGLKLSKTIERNDRGGSVSITTHTPVAGGRNVISLVNQSTDIDDLHHDSIMSTNEMMASVAPNHAPFHLDQNCLSC